MYGKTLKNNVKLSFIPKFNNTLKEHGPNLVQFSTFVMCTILQFVRLLRKHPKIVLTKPCPQANATPTMVQSSVLMPLYIKNASYNSIIKLALAFKKLK